MAHIADAKDIEIGKNAGKVAANNAIDIKGGIGENASLGNTTSIKVKGQNTEKGCIGSDNKFKVEGGLGKDTSVGNTANVSVGENSGAIGSGNTINIG